MKNICILAAGVFLLSLLGPACQTAEPAPTANFVEFADLNRIGLPVYGMSCPKCANNIVLQLKDLEGVRSVDVDMGSGFVTVHAEEGKVPTRAVLVEAITAAGFSVPTKKE